MQTPEIARSELMCGKRHKNVDIRIVYAHKNSDISCHLLL